ncbi:MAG TPA: sulfotransferase [Conexibacter sp.]|nr:sulfotransferase [Conexibacter sp.]
MNASTAPALRTPAIEIADVEPAPRGDRVHANLERPIAGEPVSGFCVPLVGWAVAPDGTHVDIKIRQGRDVVRRLARRIPRPDIADAYPGLPAADRSGFSLALDAVKLPREFALRVSAMAGEEEVPIADVRGARRALEPIAGVTPAPLTVTTLGRTGSTLMMTLLSLHPAIAAFHPVAHDSRPFAYWLDAAIAMASPGSRMRLIDGGAQGAAWWLGGEPVAVETLHRLDDPTRELLLGARVEQMLHTAVRHASEVACGLAADAEPAALRYAAEKCWPGHVPRLLAELCPQGREIFLVRDFRDVLASMLAFNAKRGYPAFGREHVDTDEQFVQRLAGDVEALAASWRERRDRALLVRYEQLVADPPATLARVLDHLELDATPATVGAIVDRAQELLESTRLQHRTVQQAAASSGRWESDLPPALRDAVTAAFAGPLEELGYL